MDDRTRWDARYREGAYAQRPWPSDFLQQNIQALAKLADENGQSPGRALDLACGAGRNSVFLAQHGFATQGIDISAAAIARGAAFATQVGVKVDWVCKSLLAQSDAEVEPAVAPAVTAALVKRETSPLAPNSIKDPIKNPIDGFGQYQLIILFRFVAPGLLTTLMDHLLPGGHLMVEEHLQHDLGEDIVGPRSAAFRVAPGALRAEVAASTQAYEVIEDFAGAVVEPSGDKAAVSRLWVQRLPG